jgi:hypothetical protein
LLDYDDEGDDVAGGKPSKRKKPWRYRWPDEVRDEVLARLLKLNAERAEQECLAGIAATVAAPKQAKKPATGTKRGPKSKVVDIALTPARLLPTDLRLPENDPAIYAVGLVVALLSEAGGSLPWPRLLDAFVLATQPDQLKRSAPPEYEAATAEWSRVWNETATPHDLLPALDHLTSANIQIERSLLGLELSLQDGPRKPPPHLAYDAWLALRVAESLAPSAVTIPSEQRKALAAKAESLVA